VHQPLRVALHRTPLVGPTGRPRARHSLPVALSHLGRLNEETRQQLIKGIRRLVALGRIPPTPQLARQLIETRFECELNSTGLGCEGIEGLRVLIAETDEDLSRALTITAPHTHWSAGDFVVEQYPYEDEYHIGPSRALPHVVRWPITPISFIFAPDGPIAYEWADQSVGLDDPGLPGFWDHLRTLNEATCSRWGPDMPLGVSVNHRFKDLWSSPRSPTSEEPAETTDGDFSIVRRAAPASPPTAGSVQVGWDARSREPVSPEEYDLIRRLEEIAEQIAPSQSEELLSALHARLREHLPSDPHLDDQPSGVTSP